MHIFTLFRAVAACCAGGLVVTLGACTPKTGSFTIPGSDHGGSGRPVAAVLVTPAPPLTASEISNGSPRIHSALAANASFAPGTVAIHAPRTVSGASSTSRSARNTTSSSDGHGEFADWISNNDVNNNPVTGAYATQAVYPGYVYPNTALYAPTLRAPDPDPLEVTIAYLPTHGAFIGVYDFSNANCQFCLAKDLTSAAVQNTYVRSFAAPDGGSFQGVTVQTSADNAGVYHAYVFNYSANGWDEVVREPVARSVYAASGWDMFEYHNGGPGSQCAALPGSVYSTGISELSAGAWHPLDGTNSSTQLFRDTGCFDPPYQPVFYSYAVFNANSAWKVNVGPQPPPRNVGTTWQQLNGAALDVATGPNNAMWVIGSDNNVYTWNGSSFVQFPGASGTHLAVDSNGNPWVVNAAGNILTNQGNGWQQPAGCALDVGANGGAVWVIGCDHGVYSWTGAYAGNTFTRAAGSGNRIAVDENGNPWFVDGNGSIFFEQQGTVQQVTGCALDVGANGGNVWVTGCGQGIYYWTGAFTGNTFTQVSGGATNIAVRSNGLPIVSNSALGIYQRI